MTELLLPTLHVDNVVTVLATSRPVLINRDPGPGEVGAPLHATVALELVDPGLDGIDRYQTNVWIDGQLAFDGSAAPELTPAFAGPASAVSQSADTLRVVLDPIAPFVSQAQVTVRVVSAVTGGAHTLDETYSFTIEDRTAPQVIAAQATSPRTVRIAFNEPVQITEVEGFAFESIELPAVPLEPIAAEASGTIVTVALDTEMTPDVLYRVAVVGISDLSGNPPLPPYDTAAFTGFRPRHPPGRRFDLWSMLPKHNRRKDTTGDLRRFIACLQEVTDLLLADVDRFPDLFDIERAPAPFLDLILADLGNPFSFDLDTLAKRRLASTLVLLYRQKGTAPGIKNVIRFFMGIEVDILPFAADTLILGESELGVDWILGPSDRFARYAFDVASSIALTEIQQKHIRAVVNYLRPAHTHFINLVMPADPPAADHWVLGISELGVTAVLR